MRIPPKGGIPLKREYGPTFGQLLAPLWQRAKATTRLLAVVASIATVVLLVALVLNLLNASYARHGAVPFSFSYKGLYRTTPDPGQYVKLVRRSNGRLEDSYAVAPLRLPSYRGSVTGALPLVAASYADSLARRLGGFRLEGEGKTKISASLTGYAVSYTATVEGRKLYGRDVMLLPERKGALNGVVVQMLSSTPATVAKPVASGGVLEKPLKSFSFG